ncbi:hypothetical protein I4U23_025410 [Adineta vaga]|nr:hypothetical protein I4U23_025410 [Adineta vaga]
MFVLYYHYTHAPHPKFCILKQRRISIYTHIVSGVLEFITCWLAFGTGNIYIARIAALAAILGHVPSAYYQTSIVFGAKALIVAAYLFAISLHLFCALHLFAEPDSVYWLLNVFLIHNIYVWCRILYSFFGFVGLFKDNRYTITSWTAALILIPAVLGVSANMLFLGYVACSVLLYLFIVRPNDAERALFIGERTRDLLVNRAIYEHWINDKSRLTKSSKNIEVTDQQKAKEVFDLLDVDKNGFIDGKEVNQLLKEWKVAEAFVKRFSRWSQKGHVTYDDFYKHVWRLGETSLGHFKEGHIKESKEKARFVFDCLDSDRSGYIDVIELQKLLIQWGLPDNEVDAYLATDDDKRYSFDEFYQNLKPIWDFAYQNMRVGHSNDVEQSHSSVNMTECYSARCQQDRRLARREFNKWTKNILLQIGLETISKNHFEFDVNLFQEKDDEQIPNDFNPDQECLFCLNRQEYLGNKKLTNRNNDHQHHFIKESIVDDEENAPLDLSLKSTSNHSPLITSNHRANIKHRPLFDVKSDIPPMYGQEEFDRFMSEMITSQLEFSSQPYLNLNLFPTIPTSHSQSNKKKNSSSQDNRIAQLAKQMAYERMLQEIEYQRHPSLTNKKSKSSSNNHSSSILTESFHVNHLLNDVMMRILHEMFEKQQQQQQQTVTTSAPQPRASRKGELLFVKKQNINNDEQYNSNIFNHFNNNPITTTTTNNNNKNQQKPNDKVNPSSSSSSSTSSVSLTSSSSIQKKAKHKSKSNQSTTYIPKGRSVEIINNNNNNNNKISIGTDGKQIRPKRGQYRRYESEQLAKAVAAVLSNEMSVHKAGSYFGVPHSTLEYKVKERNTKSSSTLKSKNESTSMNDNDNNLMLHGDNDDDEDDDDDDDEKSSKGLVGFLPPSNSNLNEIDDENDSNDGDDDLEESLN